MEGIVVVEDIGLAGIVVEDIFVVETAQVDTEIALIQPAFVPHSSLGRYPSFSPRVAGRLCNPFHRALSIYKNYNTD